MASLSHVHPQRHCTLPQSLIHQPHAPAPTATSPGCTAKSKPPSPFGQRQQQCSPHGCCFSPCPVLCTSHQRVDLQPMGHGHRCTSCVCIAAAPNLPSRDTLMPTHTHAHTDGQQPCCLHRWLLLHHHQAQRQDAAPRLWPCSLYERPAQERRTRSPVHPTGPRATNPNHIQLQELCTSA